MIHLFDMRSKLFFSFLFIGLLGIAAVGVGSFYIAKNNLQAEAFDQLTALREMKQQQIETYFEQVNDHVYVFSQDFMIIDAMKDFKKTFFTVEQDDQYTPEQLKHMTERLKTFYKEDFLPKLNANLDEKVHQGQFFEDLINSTIILQTLYIVDNPYPDKRINLDRAPDKSNYSKVHAKYHPIIREYLEKFEYYDLFLIDSETGYVVYNATKEMDFAANLTKGIFKKTHVAEGFFAVQETTNKNFVTFLDFQYYAPSKGMPSAFVMTPIYEGEKKIGVLALQLDINKINKIMTNDKKWKQTGLGETGEAYIIGDDYKMRSDSRFLIEDPNTYFQNLATIEVPKNIIDKMRLLNTTILIQDVSTESAQEVMRGNSDTRFITDYRGVPNISSYTPLNIKGANWGIIAEFDYNELLETLKTVAWKLFGVGMLILLVLIVISFFLVRIIMRPLRDMLHSLQLVNRSKHLNLRERLEVEGSDIIAQLSTQINTIFTRLQKDIQAIFGAKKEMESSMSKMEAAINRTTAITDTILKSGRKERDQTQQLTELTNTLKEDLKTQSTFASQVRQFMDDIQRARISIGRVIDTIRKEIEKSSEDIEKASQLRVLLDEAANAERKIETEIASLAQTIKGLTDNTKQTETRLTDVQGKVRDSGATSSSVMSDMQKAQTALKEVRQKIEKMNEALAQFKQSTKSFTV